MLEVSFIAAFLGGLLMFLSPCVFPLLPVYFSVLEKDNKKIRNTILFVLGISTIFIMLGFSLGYISNYFYSPIVRKIGSIIIIIMGLQQLEILNLNILNKSKTLISKNIQRNSGVESFILGFTFSLGWTPCIGPILGSILFLASDSGSALKGALLLSVFVLGFSLPFILFTIFYEKLSNKINFIKRNLGNIKKISAVLIIIMGIALFFDKLDILVNYFNSISI